MTYQDAIHSLNAVRLSGKLQDVIQIVERYHRDTSHADQWDSARVLLYACDLLSSHDFGDYAQQVRLVHAYAERGLLRTIDSCSEQQLRLLAHLQHDYREEGTSREEWRTKRFVRARRWLRALQILTDHLLTKSDHEPKPMRPEPPIRTLPRGAAVEHVTDSGLRADYRLAMHGHHQNAEEETLRLRMNRLYQIYEPLAAKYITLAYAREPFDLSELRQLLTQYPNVEMKLDSSLPSIAEQRRIKPSAAGRRSSQKDGLPNRSPKSFEPRVASGTPTKLVLGNKPIGHPRKRKT